jgi:hypothetical protein
VPCLPPPQTPTKIEHGQTEGMGCFSGEDSYKNLKIMFELGSDWWHYFPELFFQYGWRRDMRIGLHAFVMGALLLSFTAPATAKNSA